MHSLTQNFIDFLLQLADSNLVLAQQNGAWCGHGPILEQDIAITNITLDLLGQARYTYQYAAECINELNNHAHATEDSLAYLRTEREYKNLLLCEQPNGDWAQTIMRQFFYTEYLHLLYQELSGCPNENLRGIALKSIKETAYHLTWCREWVVRLGDGTEESKQRMLAALHELEVFCTEMFQPAPYETALIHTNQIPDVQLLQQEWLARVNDTLEEATLPLINISTPGKTGGKTGLHTERLGYILAEMQYLQRAYPGAEW